MFAEWLRKGGSFDECPKCERYFKLNKDEPPCEQCDNPHLFFENYEAIAVYKLCRSQVLVAPMGEILGLRMEAVKTAMDLLGVENQIECLDKVLAFSDVVFKKD